MTLGKGGGASGKGSGASGKRNGASCKRSGASKERDEASHTVGGDRNRASSVCVKASLFRQDRGLRFCRDRGMHTGGLHFPVFLLDGAIGVKMAEESDFHRPPL